MSEPVNPDNTNDASGSASNSGSSGATPPPLPPDAGASGYTRQSPPVEPSVVSPTVDVLSAEEIRDGKTMAILSYVFSFIKLPVFLIPLITGSNRFASYHAKQCAMMWLVWIVGSIACIPLYFVCCIGLPLAIALHITLFVFNIIGTVNASEGRVKRLPVIGSWAEGLFGGVRAL
jgi:uncharacterized membrane protein